MGLVRKTILPFFFVLITTVSYAQFGLNSKPQIIGQTPLSTSENVPITIELRNLLVFDLNDIYPFGFTLKLYEGKNYTFESATVTPAKNFHGTLTVPVTVNDGKDDSKKFDLKIRVNEVENIPPVITAQVPLSINVGEKLTIEFSHLTVVDPDNNYPEDFSLKVSSGKDYEVKDHTVTPDRRFVGTLTVPVTVHDGEDESAKFNLKIEVIDAPNVPPVITGQEVLSTNEDQGITIKLSNLKVTDPDNEYPKGFTLKISPGDNYTVNGMGITPALNFNGTLTASITVNDGESESPPFLLVIAVQPVNDAPVITGQTPVTITENKSLTVQLSLLQVNDPDNIWPKDFTLAVLPGTNYSVSGTTITPALNFKGTLSVRVTVNDGIVSSTIFNLQVLVIPASARPQIIGQESLIINEDESITIQLADLIVSDVDDTYPNGFTLQVHPGKDYTTKSNTVTPSLDLNGFLLVEVTVKDNDGNVSDPYSLAILINPVNDAPVIKKFETTPLSYEPGTNPIGITSIFEAADVDNDHLSYAEVSISEQHYTRGYDALIFEDSANIRGFFDSDRGKLSLVGYATLAEYNQAIRSVRYQYRIPEDESGNHPEILPGIKTVLVLVQDGHLFSETRVRQINMETTVSLNIPSAFTPNGDTANETWNVQALSNAHQCDDAVIRVYNKKGLLLFQAIGLEEKWDGIFGGEVLPMDVYYYTIDLNLSYAKRTYKGVVTLLR